MTTFDFSRLEANVNAARAGQFLYADDNPVSVWPSSFATLGSPGTWAAAPAA